MFFNCLLCFFDVVVTVGIVFSCAFLNFNLEIIFMVEITYLSDIRINIYLYDFLM